MKKFKKTVIAALMTGCMLFSLAACGGGNENPDPSGTQNTPAPTSAGTQQGTNTPAPTPTTAPSEDERPAETVVIRYGTHWLDGLDPWYTDEVTGEFKMDADFREARYKAEEAIKEKYNVVFEYVQYPSDTREAILQSVMAGDPVCDLAVVWGGAESVLLSQNVVQDLAQYAYIFEDPDYSWMYLDKIYGGNYFLTDVVRFNQRWPLVYNIDLIEEAGLENPSVLFENGEWTWGKFKEMLTQLDAYYANDDTIDAYNTDYRFANLSAMYSAGGAIYGPEGLAVNSDASKRAVAFIEELIDTGLISAFGVQEGVDYEPDWTTNCSHFKDGFSCFTDCADWLVGWAGGTAAERGESIGIVPWPRPDDYAVDDERYRQVITLGDSICVPKGVDPETTELALKAFALYTKVYYTTLGGVDTMAEYQAAYAEKQANSYKIDIFHEKYGDSILESFIYITSQMPNGSDFSDMLGFRGPFDKLLGQSIYGVDGIPSYPVAIEANLNIFSETEAEMLAILASDGINDTVKPNVSVAETIVVPVGTKMNDPIWAQFITVTDNAAIGNLDMSTFNPVFNDSTTDAKFKDYYGDGHSVSEDSFNTPGYYYRAFKAYFSDASGNEGYATASVYVYDPNNTEKPVIELNTNDLTRYMLVNTDLTTYNWIGDDRPIKSVKDADGVDLSAKLVVDLSTLDTANPGEYQVAVSVRDYAGNEATETITIIVE